MVYYAVAAEPDSFISVTPIYYTKDSDLRGNKNLLFEFQVDYTRAPDEDSDGEEDLENLETRTVHQTHEFNKDWLIGGDEDHILAVVYHILDLIEAPCYRDIVKTLTEAIVDLKKRDAISALPSVERIKVTMDVIAYRFPGENDNDAVVPASEEAVTTHLETVVLETEGYCAICMDKIKVGSDMTASRMPCLHVFHHTCGEKWLRNSGICPVCRAVLPS